MLSEYSNIKIPEEKIENLKKALRKKGVNPRSSAEAVNTVIDSFILKADLEVNFDSQHQEESIKSTI